MYLWPNDIQYPVLFFDRGLFPLFCFEQTYLKSRKIKNYSLCIEKKWNKTIKWSDFLKNFRRKKLGVVVKFRMEMEIAYQSADEKNQRRIQFLLKPYIWPQVKIHPYIQHPCQIIIAWARTFRNCTRAMCSRYNAVHQAKRSFINYVDKTS